MTKTKAPLKLVAFDAARYLDDDEAIAWGADARLSGRAVVHTERRPDDRDRAHREREVGLQVVVTRRRVRAGGIHPLPVHQLPSCWTIDGALGARKKRPTATSHTSPSGRRKR